MQNDDRKAIIQKGFDTVAAGYDHPSLFFFPEPAAKKLNNTQFSQMDLEHLEFEKETFNIAISSFGLFFLEDMTQGLHNIASTVPLNPQVRITSVLIATYELLSVYLECFEFNFILRNGLSYVGK